MGGKAGVIVLDRVASRRAAALRYIGMFLARKEKLTDVVGGLISLEAGPRTKNEDRDLKLIETLNTMLRRLGGGNSVSEALAGGVFPDEVVAFLRNTTPEDLPQAFSNAAEYFTNHTSVLLARKTLDKNRARQPA